MIEYTITKSGNYGIISPIPQGVLAATLDKYLQYTRKGAEFMPNPAWSIVHFLKKGGRFPFGLLSIVKAVMDKYCEGGDTYKIIHEKRIINIEPYNPANLRPYQIDAVKALIKSGGQVVMPCGAGKTVTLIEYLKLLNLKTIIICPTLDIVRQWKDYGLPNVVVSTFQNPSLRIKGAIESYDIIVIDEHHHTSARTIYNLVMRAGTNTIIIGTSASPKRDDGEDMRILAALGPIIYTIERRELIAQGYLANGLVIYLRPQFATNGKYMDYHTVYDGEIIHNAHRNLLVCETALKETLNHRKILILVNTLIHGEIILKLLEPNSRGLRIVFMNGQSKDRDQDMAVYDIIIATSIYDEGYNLLSLDTLILAGAGRSGIKVVQRVGRVLRPKADGRMAYIYDFIDTPKYLRQQYLKRRELLGYDFEIMEQSEQTRLNG